MAIVKEIVIKANTSDAVKNTDKLADSVDGLANSTDSANEALEETGKSAKKSSSNVQKMGKSFSSLKLGAIGLIVAAFVALKEILSENQKTVDLFAAGFKAVSTVVNNVVDAVTSSTEGFDSLGKVILGVLNLAITPLKLAFFGIKLGVLEAQKAWEGSVFGGKDQDKIQALTDEINKTKDSIGEVADAAIQSGKDVASNFGEAITEISSAVSAGVEAVEKTSLKAAIAQGKRLIELQKQAEIAMALNTGLIEQYDSQAEKLRQLRDDEALSIEDRKKANDSLADTLEEQFVLMQKNADAVLVNAQAQYEANKSQENYIALIEAQNEKLAISAQIEGFRSEQIINNVSLKKEEIELDVTASDAEKERRIDQLNFDAEREQNEKLRIEKLKEVIEIEKELALEKLERDKEIYKEGTQARIDAEQEYLDKKQELEQRETTANDENAKNKTDTDKKLKNSKLAFANESLKGVIKLAGEESEIGKGLAIGQATISGIEGVQNAYSTAQESPITAFFPAYPAIQAGLAGAFSALQISKIKGTSANGSGGGSSSVSAPSSPTFNLSSPETNQIASTISTTNDKPVQAFVVGSAVTSSQELDRNKLDEGSIG